MKKTPTKKTSPAKVEKDIILVIGLVKGFLQTIREFKRLVGKGYKFAGIYPSKTPLTENQQKVIEALDIAISCDFNSDESIEKALKPYKARLLAVTVRGPEGNMHLFQKVIPHVPYLNTPTSESLYWSTNKVAMRKRLRGFDKKIAPNFMIVTDDRAETIKEIEEKIKYPLVVKPASLAQSLLVTICYHRDELEQALANVFRKIKNVYKENKRHDTPEILVEQFMEGEMYSIDAYVNQGGVITYCPLVHVKTGVSIGFDDFFGYKQITPTKLKPENVRAARDVARKSIEALNLRSTTTHIELMRMEDGWKVIEVGPRMGGFRDHLYETAYGFDHGVNDLLTRIPGKKPTLYNKRLGHAVAMKFYAKQEGEITNITGIKKIQELDSFKSLTQNKKVGDKAIFAKNGGKSVFDLMMFNEDRSQLLADIRRAEKEIKILVKKRE